ncbi:hypothetical protein AYR56_05235 [Loigolactobacillus backii]|uniref:DUF1642 domain-containing protein n=1 Tax=Loigolactobacillus backii TaxID=375175 RepID=A0A192H3K0_9LACO|nr:DUF1642 domain-containing protein [Loigolactobacillus backii]ANK63389.1 hypothetical protein AYR53_11770 [Loigolactobacillus backii]ANK69606.1 hypothetical protein AYR56_05235 [Loigolactobacillus backii]
MSEEKLYAVKNDEGKYLDSTSFWNDNAGIAFKSSYIMLEWAEIFDGHVVTLIEEPEKVVLSEKQAKIVEGAHNDKLPACYISSKSDDEELLMKAYVNGYTVAKEKKYGVWVPYINNKMYYKDGRGSDDLDIASADCLNDKNQQFTEAEIEHYGLQDCEKEEVTDDEL